MALDDIYRITFVWSNADTGQAMSSAHYYRQNDLVAPSITTIGGIAKNFWNNLAGIYDPGKALTKVTLRRVKPLEAVEQVYTTGLPIAGSASDNPSGIQTCALFSLRTALIGRSYRGRMYFPGLVEGATGATAQYGTTEASTMIDNFNEYLDDLRAENAVPVVYSPKLDSGEDVTTVYFDRVPRTQRRRAEKDRVYVTT